MSNALATVRNSLAALHANTNTLLIQHAQVKSGNVSEEEVLAVAKEIDAVNEKVVAALNAPAAPSKPNNPLAG